LFLVLIACLAAPAAERELEGIRAVAGGMALGMGGDKPEVQAAVRGLVKAAFPERFQ
jgi:hypothetical protein